jgi:hypothetical protein
MKINMILDTEGGCKMQCGWWCVQTAFSDSDVALPSYHSSGSLWKERNVALGREPLVGVSSTFKPHTENGTRAQFNRGEPLNLLHEQCVT